MPKEEKTTDITESILMDPEFMRWMKISDRIQGISDSTAEPEQEKDAKLVIESLKQFKKDRPNALDDLNPAVFKPLLDFWATL